MSKGLVFGKFLPLHKGHIALIEFALKHCDHLYICVCFSSKEQIDPITRKQWLYQAFENSKNITIVSFGYDENELPNTSVSSKKVSKQWAAAFKKLFPDVDTVFTSEPYGEFVAAFMNIRHILFDEARISVPVSATQIRQSPFHYWDYIPGNIRYWFVKKICIIGSESTGKSTLTEKLAHHYDTSFVPEMAREIIEKTEECTYDDLLKITELHAKTIQRCLHGANKLLFIDTDINITRSYSEFLFGKELIVEPWMEDMNKCDLYLFLETDSDFVQDGTRISKEEREKLSLHHKKIFHSRGIEMISITGDWELRFKTACKIIDETFSLLS